MEVIQIPAIVTKMIARSRHGRTQFMGRTFAWTKD